MANRTQEQIINRRECQTLGEGPKHINIYTAERGNLNNNNTMDARSVWERSYEDDYVPY